MQLRTSIAARTPGAQALLGALDLFSWEGDQRGALEATRALLVEKHEELMHLLIDESQGSGAELDLFSRETSTHWKLFLGACEAGCILWLHDYKSSAERRAGYADSVHDHRYSFVSAILRGGYTDHRYLHQAQATVPSRSNTFLAPSCHVVTADAIHSVSDIQPHTLTLIVQAPTAREYSTEYFLDDRAPRKHYDLEKRWRALAAS